MNIKIKSIVSLIALSTAAFAADPIIPAAEPTVATPESQVSLPADANAPTAEQTVATETAPITEPVVQEAPQTEIPETSPIAEDVYAPTAVRGGEVPAQKTAPVQTPAAQQTVYYPVYTPEPTAVRQEGYVPVQTVYVAQNPSKDTVSFEELRGFVPMKLSFGIQAFIGTYQLSGDEWYDIDTYDGFTWRAGAFGVFPLNEYTIGLKTGLLFEQSNASATVDMIDDSGTIYQVNSKFKQRKLDIPLLFSFKAPRSSFMFDVGTQISIPVKDEFRISYDDEVFKYDMIDKEYRNSIDWNLVFGFSVKANNFLAFDLRFDCGFTNIYSSMKEWRIDDLSSSAFLLGVSFYIF